MQSPWYGATPCAHHSIALSLPSSPYPAPLPMAASSHLGLFQVSVIALPVTEATVGGPSGGVGTTSAWGGGQGYKHSHCPSLSGHLPHALGDTR